MSFDRLHQSIWSDIIGFCKRDTPPAFREATWSDLHQHDLATLARVSSTMHKLVIPHLYTSPIVNDLVLFLPKARADKKNLKSLGSKVASKKECLEIVKHLRYAGLGEDWVWEGRDLWYEKDTKKREAWEKKMEGKGYKSLMATAAISDHFTNPKNKILPNIETIVIGQRGRNFTNVLFNQLYEGVNPKATWDGAVVACKKVASFFVCLEPRQICVHQKLDFFAPIGELFLEVSSGSLVTTHHDHSVGRWQPIVPYWTNRHICPPGANYYLDPLDEGDFVGPVAYIRPLWSQERKIRSPNRQPAGTDVEFFGNFDQDENASGSEPNLDDEEDDTAGGEADSGKPGAQVEFEQKLETKIHESWKGHIRFGEAKKTPDCEACGWTLADGW